jgi:hypothetical protein
MAQLHDTIPLSALAAKAPGSPVRVRLWLGHGPFGEWYCERPSRAEQSSCASSLPGGARPLADGTIPGLGSPPAGPYVLDGVWTGDASESFVLSHQRHPQSGIERNFDARRPTADPVASLDASVPAVSAPQPPPSAAVVAGHAPSAQELQLALVPSATSVAYDSAMTLDVSVTNTTGGTLALRIAIPELVQSTDARGAVSPAPLTSANGSVDPSCARVDCVAPAGDLPQNVTLAPGSAMHTKIRWKAERLAVGLMGCCPQPHRVGPLAPGRYTLTANVIIDGIGLVAASTQIVVHK